MKRCALLVSMLLGIAHNPVFARDINSPNKIGARAGIRVSSYPWTVKPSGKPDPRLDENEITAHGIKQTDTSGEILDDKFTFFLPRQKALIGVTYTYLIVEPAKDEDKTVTPIMVQAVARGFLKNLGLSASDQDKATGALSGAIMTSTDKDNSALASLALAPVKFANEQARTDAATKLKAALDNFFAEQTTFANLIEIVKAGGAKPEDVGFSSDASDAVGGQGTTDNADNTPKPTNSISPPAGIDIHDVTGFVSIDKPVTFKLIAFPDPSLGFVADYSHAYPLTADLKHGMISIGENGIITGVNSEHVDQLPAIVTDVAIASIDVAKAIATWGASGIFSASGAPKAKTEHTESVQLKPYLFKLQKIIPKSPKTPRLKVTNAFDITVQKLLDLENPSCDGSDDSKSHAKDDVWKFEQSVGFSDDVKNLLAQKAIKQDIMVPPLVLTVRSSNSTFPIHFCQLKSKRLLDGKFLEGVVLRQPQTVRFTLSTGVDKAPVDWATHPNNDPTKPLTPPVAMVDASRRILFDDYAQLAQTGTLTAVSLRTKGSRDGAKSITLTAAGGIKSCDETTTSSLKVWTDAVKAIAAAL